MDKLDKEPWAEVRREMVEDKGLGAASADRIGTFVTRKGAPRAMLAELLKDGVFTGHAAAEATLLDMAKLFDYLDAMGALDVVRARATYELFDSAHTSYPYSFIPHPNMPPSKHYPPCITLPNSRIIHFAFF